MNHKSLEDRIDQALVSNDDLGLKEILALAPEEEIARCINHFVHGKKKIFRLTPAPKKRLVLWDLNLFSRKYILQSLTNTAIYNLVHGTDSDDAADIIDILPLHRRKVVLKLLSKKESEEIEEILDYPEDSAGHIMQKELIRVPETFSILDCIKRIQRLHHEVKDIGYVFVTNTKNIFVGYVPIEQLIIRKPHVKIKGLITGSISVPVSMDQEEVAHIFKNADLSVLPVVDGEGHIVGRITADDVVDVLEEEQSEDMYQMAGVTSDEDVFDPAILSAKKRLPWLMVNLGTAILAASVVSFFQGTIQKLVILAAYMPIVAGMGGNAATQTITVLVRSIALKQVQFKDLRRILFKEFFVGAVNGISLGFIIGIISFLYNGNFMLGVVIGLAMITNLVIAGVSGTIIPLTLKALKLDPALASSVFVTTCTDVGGFVSFLGLATILLR